MLKYVLGGIGFLFFWLIVSDQAQLFLSGLAQSSPVIMSGISFLPLLTMCLAFIYDIVMVTKGVRCWEQYPLLSTCGGIGFLWFWLLITESGTTLIKATADFPLPMQVALISLPGCALIFAFFVELTNTVKFLKKVKAK